MSKLKEMREFCGLSQSKLAAESGVTLRMIQQWEQGVKNIDGAKLHTLTKLAITLNCKISEIIEDEGLIKLLKKATL